MPERDYDVIIIGAGHNGLVASYYLARAGLRVAVLESRKIVGGCCVTEELIPGFRFSTCANVIWAMRPKIVRDMALHKRGLIVDTRQFLRLLPGGRYTLTGRVGTVAPGESLAAVQKEIAKISAADAAAFPRWTDFQARLIRVLGPYLLRTPPRLEEILAGCPDPEDRKAVTAAMSTSIAGLTDRFFESEVMRDVSVGADIPDCRDVGTGMLWAVMTAMGSYSETGEGVLNGFVRGGMGRLTELMAEAAREAGAAIHTETPVARILTEGGRAIGVALRSGGEIRARIVVSNLDPKRTFLSLLGPSELEANFAGRVRGLQTHAAAGLKFHGALSEIPDYRVEGRLTDEQRREATLILAPNREYRAAAWRAASQGELPDEPVLGGMLPSVYDPTLAPPGKYTWSAYLTWAPVRPRRGPWSKLKEEMGEKIIRLMEKHTTNFRRSLIDYLVLTPEDLEERYNLTDGNIHHVDGSASQLLWRRPLEELAHYRTPVRDLYLSGAGTHPWGEVSGAPGHNAAHVILGDLQK